MDLVSELISMWWISVVALISPILAAVTKKKIPDIVWMLILGMLIGPSLFAIAAQTPGINFLRQIGLGLLFFMAGLEINQDDVRSAAGRSAGRTWIICLILAISLGYLITGGVVQHAIILGIASTSTALGALLPILKETKQFERPIGVAAMRHGAIGELGPIIAMTLLLSTRAPWESMAILLAFAVAAIIIVAVPSHLFARIPHLHKIMVSGMNTTMQTLLRFTMFLLFSLMALSAILHLDIVLGAFATGLVIGRITPEHSREGYISRLEIVGFSLLIPVFFITSGMNIDAQAVINHPAQVLLFMLMILLVRGLPVFLREFQVGHNLLARFLPFVEKRETTLPKWQQKMALGYYAATGLPIIVAVTEVALHSELISEEAASIMVAAGALTVLLYPLLGYLVFKQISDELDSKEAKTKIEDSYEDKASIEDKQEISVKPSEELHYEANELHN